MSFDAERPKRPIPLSILDQSPVASGAVPAAAIAATIDLASQADRLGYHRYWLAEHHAMAGLADSSPEILLARLTSATSDIRLGTGGIMLPHYSAYKVAENFRMLDALAPGRIDVGLGRAPGGTRLVNAALESRDPDVFPQQIADLVGWLRDALPEGHPFSSLPAMPGGITAPQPWILGSSEYGAMLAAKMGLPYAYAHFIGGDAPHLTRMYRRMFRSTGLGDEPRVMLATAAIVARSADAARELALPLAVWRAHVQRGRSIRVPSLADAREYVWSPGEYVSVQHERRVVTGDPNTARLRLEDLADEHEADELMIVTITPDYESRVTSYALLADAFARSPADLATIV